MSFADVWRVLMGVVIGWCLRLLLEQHRARQRQRIRSVLEFLAAFGPKRGKALIDHVRASGAFYTVLFRLEEEGLISSEPEPEGGGRRWYTITDKGLRLVEMVGPGLV